MLARLAPLVSRGKSLVHSGSGFAPSPVLYRAIQSLHSRKESHERCIFQMSHGIVTGFLHLAVYYLLLSFESKFDSLWGMEDKGLL